MEGRLCNRGVLNRQHELFWTMNDTGFRENRTLDSSGRVTGLFTHDKWDIAVIPEEISLLSKLKSESTKSIIG